MIPPKFDQHASQYDTTTPIQSEVAHYLWQKILAYQDFYQDFLAPQIWLDVGCGTGKLSQYLLNNFSNGSGFRLIALDKSPAMLEQFSQRISQQMPQQANKLPFSQRMRFLTADMTAMPLPHYSVDRVMSSFALHWADTSVLDELVRVSRVDGQIHLAIPVTGSLSAVQARFPQLPIFPFLPTTDWLDNIEKVLLSRQGQWLYNEQHRFSHRYANLAELLASLKSMGGAVSGQMPMNGAVLRQYLADSQPIDLDYQVLLVGFRVGY